MADDNKVQFIPLAIYPKRTKLIFALAALKKDADEKRKTLILLFSPAFILKIQKNRPSLDFGCKKGCKSRNNLIYTLCCGEGGILYQLVQNSYPFYMCLILPIIRSTMGYWDKLSALSPSQSSHTILSASHRCNFLVAKMHQKHPYLHQYNILITNKIIIILSIITFSLERFFSIFSFLRYSKR